VTAKVTVNVVLLNPDCFLTPTQGSRSFDLGEVMSGPSAAFGESGDGIAVAAAFGAKYGPSPEAIAAQNAGIHGKDWAETYIARGGGGGREAVARTKLPANYSWAEAKPVKKANWFMENRGMTIEEAFRAAGATSVQIANISKYALKGGMLVLAGYQIAEALQDNRGEAVAASNQSMLDHDPEMYAKWFEQHCQ
jgi:cytochrome c551/c552